MSHKHEWYTLITSYECDYEARCECGSVMDVDEIERRVNATECLSAKDATTLYRLGEFEKYPILISKLLRYAEAFDD